MTNCFIGREGLNVEGYQVITFGNGYGKEFEQKETKGAKRV